jgi:3-oxoacyl-(acyl-carrier-protein) synthase
MSVQVTGWALRTPIGHSTDEVVQRWAAGERAFEVNQRFPSASYACSLAAMIRTEPAASPHQRILRRMGLFAVEAAHEAFAMAGCASGDRLGVFAAMGGLRVHWADLMPALASQTEDFSDSWQRGLKRLHPFWMLSHLSNNAHALLAQDLGARGDGATFAGGNAGAQALVAAQNALAAGVIEAALVVGYDSLIEPEALVEMAERGVLTTSSLHETQAAYGPLANGMVPGEAAAAVVLEAPERAAKRALANVYAATGADGSTGEASVETIARVAAKVPRSQLLDGCGAAHLERDRRERELLSKLLPDGARLTSLQASMGCLGAATSVVQAIALAACLRAGILPPVAGLRRPCDGPLVPLTACEKTSATSCLAVSCSAPGLVGAIAVSIDDLG